MKRRLALAACLVVCVSALGQAAERSRQKLNLTVPLTLYSIGGASDIWSTRRSPVGYSYRDRSFAGPVAGPAITSLCFGGADLLLQKRGHRGWAKALRVGYAVGVGAVVLHNKKAGR